jgi:hypothetical protein
MHSNGYQLPSAARLAPARDEISAGTGSELITPSETAARLRLAKQTLARWRCESRRPAFIRLGGSGGRVAYRAVDVDARLASRRAFSTAEADRVA